MSMDRQPLNYAVLLLAGALLPLSLAPLFPVASCHNQHRGAIYPATKPIASERI
jgi:hypothetical protein